MNSVQLAEIFPLASVVNVSKFWDPLNQVFEEYDINTIVRKAAFLAQIGEESGQLKYVKELWGPTPVQIRYEGRLDLGNTEPGDGRKYMGRGLIQITGRNNYGLCADALDEDLLNYPALLETPILAARSAGWYWGWKNCNAVADDIEKVTRLVNGGLTHLDRRIEIYDRALRVLTS